MSENSEMSFLDHLEILRWHLVRSISVIIVVAILAFLNKNLLFDGIIFAPKEADFITFRALCAFSAWLSSISGGYFPVDMICIGQHIPQLQNIDMAGQFTTHIGSSLVAGLVIGFPYFIWEIWRFISPGLNEKERKNTGGAVFAISALFFTGVLFGYYVIAPLSVNFFGTYSISSSVQNLPTLGTYISTVTTVVLACGILFELPVLVYFLTKAGIISAKLLIAFRKHSFVAALILSAILTPPDVFSQLLVSLPLVVLYEVSIILAKRIEKNELKKAL